MNPGPVTVLVVLTVHPAVADRSVPAAVAEPAVSASPIMNVLSALENKDNADAPAEETAAE